MKKKSTALSSISLGKPATSTIEEDTEQPKNQEPTENTGEPISSEKETHRFLLTIKKSDHKRLALYALEEETTVQAAMREAVQLFFAEKGI